MDLWRGYECTTVLDDVGGVGLGGTAPKWSVEERRMRNQCWIAVCSALLLLFLFGSAFRASAANTVQAQLNNPPSNNVLDGVYVGPYSFTDLNNQGTLRMVCDDFVDDTDYNPAMYAQHDINNLFGTKWGQLPNASMLYQEAAWLTAGMFNQNGAIQGYYSFALWSIFAGPQVLDWLKAYNDDAACNYIFGSNCASVNVNSPGVGSLLYNAEQPGNYQGAAANLLILTPPCNGAKCQEQEFLFFPARAPDGGSTVLYLGLTALVCLGALWRSKRAAISD